MPKVTFQVTDDLKHQMTAHPEVNWSEVFRRAIQDHVERSEITRQIWEEVNDPLVKEITKKVKAGMARRYREYLRARGR